MKISGGQIIEGGLVIPGAIPRISNPHGGIRYVPSGTTIQSVVDVAQARDIIYIEPGTYEENLVIATAGLTLVGLGARGQPWISPATGIGLHVNQVDDIVIVNLGIDGASGAEASLKVDTSSESRFYGCKIEGGSGPDTLTRLVGDDNGQCGNIRFEDCEWIWGTVGVEFDNSGYGYPTQIYFRNCHFGNITTVHMRDDETAGGVMDLSVIDCVFAGNQDGSEPTDYIVLDRDTGGAGLDSGIFSGNRFALAANTATELVISDNIQWVANATEAGWSTTRPS